MEDSYPTLLPLSQSIAPLIQSSTITVNEATTLLSFLKAIKKESTRIVEGSQQAVALLAFQNTEVQRCLSDLTALISPARKMPPELIRLIFEQCILEEPTHFELRRSNHYISLALGQICRGWRAVTLATPTLWSAFHVEISQNIQDVDAERLARLLVLWTSRSLEFPLTIRLTISPVFFTCRERPRFRNVHGAALRVVFAPLLIHSSRWKEFLMDVSSPVLKSILRHTKLPLTSPHLQIFSIIGTSRYSTDYRGHRFRPTFNFSSVPLLRKFSLSNVELPAYGPSFPWHTLEELTLVGIHHNLSIVDGIEIFRRSQRLQRCRLSFSRSDYLPSSYSTTQITIFSLRHLHISVYEVDITELYDVVLCPGLEELILEYVGQSHVYPITRRGSLIRFITQCSQLSTLHFRNPPIQESDLIETLKHAHSVKSLGISSSWGDHQAVGNTLLYALTTRENPVSAHPFRTT
jgi:hypothetical protein